MPPTEPHRVERARPARRDSGVTFIEILVAIVLLGVLVTVTMTALTVSIRSSDQHKSKVSAMAELEGAAAHLNRVFAFDPAADCPSPNLPAIQAALANSYAPGEPLENINEGISVDAPAVTCVNGVALVSLRARHAKGNATETLDVTVGGITVLEDGPMGSGGSGGCSWTGVNSSPNNPQRKPSGRLDSTVTVTLSYVGDCTGETVTLTVTNPPGPPTGSVGMTLNGNTTAGEFFFVFTKNYYSPWSTGPLNFVIDAVPSGASFSDSFTVL